MLEEKAAKLPHGDLEVVNKNVYHLIKGFVKIFTYGIFVLFCYPRLSEKCVNAIIAPYNIDCGQGSPDAV